MSIFTLALPVRNSVKVKNRTRSFNIRSIDINGGDQVKCLIVPGYREVRRVTLSKGSISEYR